MQPYKNRAAERMRAGEPALGMILRASRAGDFAHIAEASGHDFIFIDMQHGAYSLETTVDLCLAAIGTGVAPIVRLAGPGNLEASRLLDSGAMGIVIPGVGTAAEAAAAVNVCKFPPFGRRSVSAGYPQLGYSPTPLDKAMPFLNDQNLVIVMIETREGFENIEAIAEVEGVDVIHLGINDLMTEMGFPGQFTHPIALEAIERTLAACAKNGKFAGLGGDKNVDHQHDFIRRGGRFVTAHSEIGYIMESAVARTKKLRGGA